VDFGVRFERRPASPAACVDATSHLFWVRRFAEGWAERLGKDPRPHREQWERLGLFIRERLFCEETGWFHDAWSLGDPLNRPLAFEGLWPLAVGAASKEQAARALKGALLNPKVFNTPHPVATVAVSDPFFELRMWRGPAWNSMTLWAAEACLKYGRPDGARVLMEKALDRTAAEFERTGTIWEFYHPFGGAPESLQRKPQTEFNRPCREYLGHNPLHAMARIYAQCEEA
jgi:hypothetical protein